MRRSYVQYDKPAEPVQRTCPHPKMDRMEQRTKDVILIPCIIAVVFGFVFMLWGAWYTGVKLHAPFSTVWLKAVFSAPVPLWFVLPLIVVAGIVAWKGYAALRENAELVSANEYLKEQRKQDAHELTLSGYWKERAGRFEERIGQMESKQPRLHGVWMQTQSFWGMGRHGEEPMTQIGGWIHITSSNTDENLFLLAAFIDGRRSDIFMDVQIKPGLVNEVQVFLYFHPPLATEEGKPFEATIVVEDQFNRKYELPRQTFRATPGAPPANVRPPNAPQLHLAWRFSGWCWTDVDEVMVTGDGTLVLDNVKDEILITGVKVEGAVVSDVFDGFTLKPSEPYFRGISVKFKGPKPKDEEPLKVKLIFVDLRGNEYPVPEHEFKLLEHPERFGGIPF